MLIVGTFFPLSYTAERIFNPSKTKMIFCETVAL